MKIKKTKPKKKVDAKLMYDRYLNTRVKGEMYMQIKLICEGEGIDMSDFTRMALKDKLKKYQKKRDLVLGAWMSKVQWERKEQVWLVAWFKNKYPGVLIAASANGGKRNKIEAAFMKAEGVLKGMPDLQIFRAAKSYHGLMIEFKPTPDLDRGKAQLQKIQKERIVKLNQEGYFAIACWGIVASKKVIDWYLTEYENEQIQKETFDGPSYWRAIK